MCKQQFQNDELKLMACWRADEGFINCVNEKVTI